MKGYLIGEITKPMSALIGTWDPLMDHHLTLLKELVEDSKRRNCSPVVIMLDPNPTIFIKKMRVPVFDDVEFRKDYMQSIGIEGIIIIQMDEADLNVGFDTFYHLISKYGNLSDLWLHNRQTLGRGIKGSQDYIRRFGERFHFSVKASRFKNKVSSSKHTVQHLLSQGKLSEAIAVVGSPLFWKKPKEHFIKIVGWKTGNYTAIPLDSAFQEVNDKCALQISISGLIPDKSYIKWPSEDIEWLKFIG